MPPHDALTLWGRRLMGKGRPVPFVLAVTDLALYWQEGPASTPRRLPLPLKGRLVRQGRQVLECYLPGEERRFLRFNAADAARDLYGLIDAGQQAVQRQHGATTEVTGPGVRAARAGEPHQPGPQGQTAVPQHETVAAIRPSGPAPAAP